MTRCFRLTRRSLHPAAAFPFVSLVAGALLSCSGDHVTNPPTVDVASISIDAAPFAIERGFHRTLAASIRNTAGEVVHLPVVWRSANEKVATIDTAGRLTALDTGVTQLIASTIGISSPPVGVRVVWVGAARIAAYHFAPPAAVSPGATLRDSLHVLVTNTAGGPVAGARVLFSASTTGTRVSPDTAISNGAGIASAALTVGDATGANKVSASVLDDDGRPLPFVQHDSAAFSVRSFPAIVTLSGDGQTGLILSTLAVAPSVKVVDSTGAGRPGVPVTFTATGGGSVVTPTVSTDATGVASPGAWTLGDLTGEQLLKVTVEAATLSLKAAATGSAIHYFPAKLAAAGYATCGLLASGLAECFGQQPRVGDGALVNRATPTATSGGLAFSSLVGSPTHFCGVVVDASLACWGGYALVDTSGHVADAVVPTRLPSAVQWLQAAPGFFHNCALAVDHSAYCWGDNSQGALGDRTTISRVTPAVVSGGFSFTALVSGSYHTCGLTSAGSAFCWGLNGNGQLGDGTTTSRSTPTLVAGNVTFQSLGAGQALTCGLSTAGTAYCWGFAPGGSSSQVTPFAYAAAPAFTSLSVGAAHACALSADGKAYCWGDNSAGQLGDSTTTDRPAPTAVVGGLRFQSIAAGYAHTCARTTDGAVACWGRNRSGELGDSTSAFHLTPRYVVLGVTP